MQEGQVWECLMSAGKFQPGNLCFVLDQNKGQIDGSTEEVMSLAPLAKKLEAFNWETVSVDGHDVAALETVFSKKEWGARGRPTFVIADTVKGKGVSFIEDNNNWHYRSPSAEELARAATELQISENV
jgi:transketolase